MKTWIRTLSLAAMFALFAPSPALADKAGALYSKGLQLKQAGKTDQAIAAMAEALKLRPGYTAAHHSIGVLYRRKGDLGRAEFHLRKAATQSPKWANAHYSLAILLYQQKKRDEAVASMKKAAALDPKDATTLEQLGVMLGRKAPAEAAAVLERAARLKPTDGGILHKLGIAYRRAGDLKKAEEKLLLAAHHKLTAPLAFDLGVMFRHKKQHRKALVYYNKAVKLDPKLSDAWWDLALISDRMKETAAAEAAYRTFLTLKPKGKAADFARKRLEQMKKGAPSPR